jgi:hypothetical protein
MHTPEIKIGGKRLGRNVSHDPRSREFPVKMSDEIKTVEWQREVPVFNQGDIGSCTGNACAGALSTLPFGKKFSERDALALYSAATHKDRIRGIYPPNDTGSSGLAVMKAAKSLGYISSYTHAFSFEHMLHGLMSGPGIVGISWLTGCDNPDRDGLVKYDGAMRGGHEIEVFKVDVEKQLIGFWNSWGADWGANGAFFMSWEDCASALSNRGDATFPIA